MPAPAANQRSCLTSTAVQWARSRHKARTRGLQCWGKGGAAGMEVPQRRCYRPAGQPRKRGRRFEGLKGVLGARLYPAPDKRSAGECTERAEWHRREGKQGWAAEEAGNSEARGMDAGNSEAWKTKCKHQVIGASGHRCHTLSAHRTTKGCSSNRQAGAEWLKHVHHWL